MPSLSSRSRALLLAWLLATLPISISSLARAQGASSADDIAQRFAGESEAAQAQAAARQKAEAVAAAEAARRKAEEQKRATEARKAEAQRKAAEAKRRADAARIAAEQLKADEAEMLARAREEADQRLAEMRAREAELIRAEAEREAASERAEAERRAAETAAREAKAARRQAEAAEVVRKAEEKAAAERKLADERRLAEEKAAADRKAVEEQRMAEERRLDAERVEAQRQAMEEQREAEGRRLAEKIRRAQEQRAADQIREAAPPPAVAASPPAPASQGDNDDRRVASNPMQDPAPASDPAQIARQSAATTSTLGGRVTVLLVMDPGNRGIRRYNKTADPVLCVSDACYVSNGPDAAARQLTRMQTLGTFNTLGPRAGACNDRLRCVFRSVELGGDAALLQPIDLRIMRHDRRETREIRPDHTCEVQAGRLHCALAIRTDSYRAWILPEAVAERAGAAGLEAILQSGLPEARQAILDR